MKLIAAMAGFGLAFSTLALSEEKTTGGQPDPKLKAQAVEEYIKNNKDAVRTEAVEKVIEEKGLDKDIEGFKFGIGLGFEKFKGGYVNEARTVGTNNVVQVTDSQTYRPTLWLETHYIWDGLARRWWDLTHSAPGFYVGIRVAGGDSDGFDAFSVGLMWAFKRSPLGTVDTKEGKASQSLNVGFGPVWHRTKKLATGIVEGQPLPAQYNQVEFDARDETSWMLMISVGF